MSEALKRVSSLFLFFFHCYFSFNRKGSSCRSCSSKKRRCAMTLAETKEPVKTGKRKVREWEEEPEVTEWWTRMEERVSGMEEWISEVKETVERVERMLTLGVARLLEQLDQLEESFEYEDSEKGAEEKKVHQEIVKIHIRHYEPPKCIVDGRLRYELVTIL